MAKSSSPPLAAIGSCSFGVGMKLLPPNPGMKLSSAPPPRKLAFIGSNAPLSPPPAVVESPNLALCQNLVM
ncbi:hypothetical protein PHSY_004385 [Pseudozyma hubeiensis SY62]|uniref:Uncharacterized protein n=1 Tax=Pseudozyma hubeiensis (strain SY62) TaxID=1305764 RepID=R9P632_PSEHS|nr:hypothetical protein PHSY_004385 [Pseudozyma hubeiensis SY62]GAC96801.1 hypothetical protein PHSY_004385 [Pseudozyma hubeiensis SY62]